MTKIKIEIESKDSLADLKDQLEKGDAKADCAALSAYFLKLAAGFKDAKVEVEIVDAAPAASAPKAEKAAPKAARAKE